MCPALHGNGNGEDGAGEGEGPIVTREPECLTAVDVLGSGMIRDDVWYEEVLKFETPHKVCPANNEQKALQSLLDDTFKRVLTRCLTALTLPLSLT